MLVPLENLLEGSFGGVMLKPFYRPCKFVVKRLELAGGGALGGGVLGHCLTLL